MFDLINQKKQQLDNQRPFPPLVVQKLREKIILEWTYHSNAIEGNTLTMNETKVVLEGITVGGKRMTEHLEVINHRDAIHYVEHIVTKKEDLSEWQLKNIHRLVLKGIHDEDAGVYRQKDVYISGATHEPPAHFLVPEAMHELMEWYYHSDTLHPVERAAILHAKFVCIHPFIDGNGRTARLLLNFELMKAGYPPIIIKANNRLSYYDALDKACAIHDNSDFISYVASEVNRSLDMYSKVL